MSDHRYSRQELIPDWSQEKLSGAKVLILGVGATGSYVATNLAMSGVGTLVLVDYDTIELSNLNRQLLFRPADIGKNKAEVAARELSLLNPDIEIIAFPKKMQELPKSMKSDTSVIACCLDTFQGRRWANSLALNEKVPMVNGGMFAFMGDVQTIQPYETACFECQPLVSQEKLAQACTPLGQARKELADEKEEVTLPSVSTLSSIISGLMSQEIMKLLLEIGVPLKNYLFYDGLSNSFTELELRRNDNCPICGKTNELEKTEALAFRDELVGEFKARIALAFGLADPKLLHKGKYLQEELKLTVENGDTIFALDDRLASPVGLKIRYQDQS
ncbi:MAG: HesA/MoeB/ThiF family protein [Candidatus Kariarchaeaceae archaeon]|jgi:adenylyltransferase/sulfurtransferase